MWWPVSRGAAPVLLMAFVAGPAHAEAVPIRVGAVLPFSAPFDVYSKSIEIAMRMASEETATVAGRPLELLFENDENKPPLAAAKARKLIATDKVHVLVGGLATNLAVALRREAIAARQPTVIVNASAGSLTGRDCSEWTLRVSFSNEQIVRDSGAWLYARGHRSAYVLAVDHPAGHEIVGIFKREFVKAGGAVAGEAYAPFATRDFAPLLVRARNARPDVVFVFFPGSMGVLFVLDYEKAGLKGRVPLAGPAWTIGPLFLDKQGKAAIGFRGPTNYVATIDSPANRKFVEEFRKRANGRDPDEVAVNGYDAIRLIAIALKAIGGRTDDKRALMAALRSARYEGPRGPLRIDPRTNNVVQNVYMIEVKEVAGKPVPVVLDTIRDVQDPPHGCAL